MSSDARISAIDASPAAVAVHDKQAWLALFSSDAEVHDPVGSRPHVGQEAISRFYDTFIAPNQIRFDVEHDVVSGNTVVRDLIIQTTLSTGLEIGVPTHIRYELSGAEDDLGIRRLYAHWQLRRMVMQTLGMGLKGIITYAKLSVHMIRCQGMSGVLGFMRGFLGVGNAGKRRAEAFLTAISRNDSVAARTMLEGSKAVSMLPNEKHDIACVAAALMGLRWSKLIVSGRQVTATVYSGEHRGVVWLEMQNGCVISNGRFYFSESLTNS